MIKVWVDESAGLEGTHEMWWWGSRDDLIRFIYGNQSVLFVEDARLFEVDGDLWIMSERRSKGRLVVGSFE